MATLYTSTLLASNANNAVFRAWCAFLHGAFLLGFEAAADTGQVDLDTVTYPTATQTSRGYKVYQTNDPLTPVYLKVEFGSSSTATFPAIWLTVGTATDGAGTITGKVLLARTQLVSNYNNVNDQHVCFASGAAGRLTLAMFTSLAGYPFWFSFERRKDTNLADADTGIVLDWGGAAAGHRSLCAPFQGVIPVPESGLQFILTSVNPGIYDTTVPEGLRIPCLGPSEPPGLNVALCNSSDWGPFAEVPLTVNGITRIYKHCGPYVTTLRGGSTGPYDVATRLLLRYE